MDSIIYRLKKPVQHNFVLWFMIKSVFPLKYAKLVTKLKVNYKKSNSHTHTHTYIYKGSSRNILKYKHAWCWWCSALCWPKLTIDVA